MSAREKILSAYETLLLHGGEKAATLDAVAKSAGVSKGGLLYHFPSKESLIQGLLEHFERLSRQDAELMRTAQEGASAYYVNTSFYRDSPFDRALIAVSRLAQEANRQASVALEKSQELVTELILAEVGDPDVTRAIILLADGMYYNAAFMGATGSARERRTEENDRRVLFETIKILKSAAG